MVIGNTAKAGVRFFAFDQFKDLLKDSEGKTTGARSVLGNYGNLSFFFGRGEGLEVVNKQKKECYSRIISSCFSFIPTYSGTGSRNDRGGVGSYTFRNY